MNIVRVFDWFARDSAYAAEHTDQPRQRDIWIKLAELWKAAALAEETGQKRRSLAPQNLGETFMKRTGEGTSRDPRVRVANPAVKALCLPRFRVTGFCQHCGGGRASGGTAALARIDIAQKFPPCAE